MAKSGAFDVDAMVSFQYGARDRIALLCITFAKSKPQGRQLDLLMVVLDFVLDGLRPEFVLHVYDCEHLPQSLRTSQQLLSTGAHLAKDLLFRDIWKCYVYKTILSRCIAG